MATHETRASTRLEKSNVNRHLSARKIGVFAAILTGVAAVDPGGNALVFAVNHTEGDYPSLSKQTSDRLADVLDITKPIRCEDTTKPQLGRRVVSENKDFVTAGYVAYYNMFLKAVRIPSDTIHLNIDTCKAVASIESDLAIRDTQQLAGLFVANHEFMHTTGVLNEAKANCYALQDMPARLVDSGYVEDDVRSVGQDIRALIATQPSNYRSLECRVDGAYDRTPHQDSPSDIWLSGAPIIETRK